MRIMPVKASGHNHFNFFSSNRKGTKEVASQPVTKETTLVSDDLKNIRLEEKIQREKQQLQQRQNLTPNQQYAKENPIVANHSPNSLTSTPYSVSTRSRDGSTDSLDGANTSVTSDNQPRHSNSSLLSSSSSSSSHPHSNELHNNAMGSRLRANGGPNVHHHDDNISHGSGRTSTSSLSDAEKLTTTTSVAQPPRFVHETLNLWYKPDISREQALEMLRDKPAGYFVVRDSRCFPGAFGLALKVEKLPINVRPQPGVDIQNELVRHFLIEPSSRGVKLKGCPNEPVFGSLSALVYQHSITPLALPCRLVIPKLEPGSSPMGTLPRAGHDVANSATDLLRQGAACNVIYINSVITESLTGPPAIERAIQDILKNTQRMAVVHFKVSPQGVTLTDNARKIFFRRHYPTSTVTYCGLDPRGNDPRRYDTSAFGGRTDAWMFGFVAKKQSSSSDNVCHVFAELEAEQPARAIVNFVSKVLIGTSRS